MKNVFLVRYEAGYYGYKNGYSIKHEGKFWKVYNCRREHVFTAHTLRRCVEYAAAPAHHKDKMERGEL